MAGTKEFLPYYLKIQRIIKATEARIQNRRQSRSARLKDEGYMKTADCLLLFEGNADEFAKFKPEAPSPWIKSYPASRFGVVVHTVATPAGMRRAIEQTEQARAGCVFVTDRLMPNPYDGLPEYWDEEKRLRDAGRRRPKVRNDQSPIS